MWSQKTYRRYLRQKNLQEALKKQKQHRWLNKKTERQIQYIVIMFFVGLLLTGIYGTITLISWNYVIRIYLVLAFVFSFMPARFFPLIYKIQTELKLLLTVCGLAPLILGILLCSNFHFSTHKRTEIFKVEKFIVYYGEHIINVHLENNALKKHKELRKFSSDEFHFIPDSAAYEISTGYLGFDIVKNSYLIKK